MPNPTRRAVALAVLATTIIAATVALDLPSAAAQSDEQAGRIVAQRLADGRTEFGWQPTGGERVLPSARYFPPNVPVGHWLNSSPVEVEGVVIGRINARMLADGRIEFAFTPTDGERIEPSARYFPVDARVGRWLRSTEITISAAPTAGFAAVSAGAGHACAIRAGSGAIECWGWNRYGQTDAPAGSFSAVSAGELHTCAIRENGAIECWGGNNNDGETDAPAGSFTAVAAGNYHNCAIGESGEITCWGRSSTTVWLGDANEELYTGQTDAPTGSFTAVSAGAGHSCGLRESGAIECWGSNNRLEWNEETETFDVVHAGQATPPAGSFSAVSAGHSYMCAIGAGSGAIECWGSNSSGQTNAPAGSFSAVNAGNSHTCAIRESGVIECWGRNDDGEATPPTGSFTAVSADYRYSCAVRAGSGAIECWGSNSSGQTNAPTP